MCKYAFSLARLRADQYGNVLALSAVGILVGAALIGGGFDMSRAYRAKNRMQAACDAAVLSGRKQVTTNGFTQQAQQVAANYFATNFDSTSNEVRDVQFQTSSDDDGNTIEATATAIQNTTLMRIFGFENIALDVTCTASMGVGNSDVVMVLDTTGSMNSILSGTSVTRIAALRSAMKNFYTTLSQATAATNARIRYGFVPYSQTVNVGHLLNPEWLVDDYNYSSRRPAFNLQITNVFDSWGNPVFSTSTSTQNNSSSSWVQVSSTNYNSLDSCSNALPANTAWVNSGSPSTTESTQQSGSQLIEITSVIQPQSRTAYSCRKVSGKYRIFNRQETRDQITSTTATSQAIYRQEQVEVFDHWEYDWVKFDTSNYKMFATVSTLTGGAGNSDPVKGTGAPVPVSSTWDGCIIERQTQPVANFSYSAMLGMTPSDAFDLDLDSAPSNADPATKWVPYWDEIAYQRWDNSGQYTQAATTKGSPASSTACPTRARLLAQMDKASFDAYADSLVPRGNTYHDIGLIWGGRLISPTGIFEDNVTEAPANGGEVARHVIFMTDGIMEPNSQVLSAYGIERNDRRVTTNGITDLALRHTARFEAVCEAIKAKGVRIWVIAFSNTLSTPLSNCASDQSAFEASNAAQLNAAFQEIAKQVGELRIVQ